MMSAAPYRNDAEQAWLLALGRTIREVRTVAGLSQVEAANRAGLHNTYLNRVERGRANLSVLALLRLADALETEPGGLLPRSGIRSLSTD